MLGDSNRRGIVQLQPIALLTAWLLLRFRHGRLEPGPDYLSMYDQENIWKIFYGRFFFITDYSCRLLIFSRADI
jgi:hypothetical protein